MLFMLQEREFCGAIWDFVSHKVGIMDVRILENIHNSQIVWGPPPGQTYFGHYYTTSTLKTDTCTSLG